jgi:hypothetical protein
MTLRQRHLITKLVLRNRFRLQVVGCVYYASHESFRDTWNIGSGFCSASVFCIIVGLIIDLISVLGKFSTASYWNHCCDFVHTQGQRAILNFTPGPQG